MTLTPENANWIDLINESVHTSDEVDIGHINALSRDFIVVKRGLFKAVDDFSSHVKVQH